MEHGMEQWHHGHQQNSKFSLGSYVITPPGTTKQYMYSPEKQRVVNAPVSAPLRNKILHVNARNATPQFFAILRKFYIPGIISALHFNILLTWRLLTYNALSQNFYQHTIFPIQVFLWITSLVLSVSLALRTSLRCQFVIFTDSCSLYTHRHGTAFDRLINTFGWINHSLIKIW